MYLYTLAFENVSLWSIISSFKSIGRMNMKIDIIAPLSTMQFPKSFMKLRQVYYWPESHNHTGKTNWKIQFLL